MSITQDNDQDRPFKKSSFKANQIQERKKKKKVVMYFTISNNIVTATS